MAESGRKAGHQLRHVERRDKFVNAMGKTRLAIASCIFGFGPAWPVWIATETSRTKICWKISDKMS